jgi:hypothetical protein
MKYTVRVTDGHYFRDIEIETDKGVEEACSLAVDRAKEIERTGDVCCWEAFESSGQAEYVDSVSTGDFQLDVPIEYRCCSERSLLHEISELKVEINRLRGSTCAALMTDKSKMVCSQCGSEEVLVDAYARWNVESQGWEIVETFEKGA